MLDGLIALENSPHTFVTSKLESVSPIVCYFPEQTIGHLQPTHAVIGQLGECERHCASLSTSLSLPSLA